MMIERKNWIKFMVGVAMACTGKERPEFPLKAEAAAEFLRDVLQIALNDRKHDVRVEVVPYPVTTKAPLLVSLDDSKARLFWYYPMQEREQMASDIAELAMDLSGACKVPLATA